MVRVFFDHDLLKKNKSKGKFRDFIKREKLLNVENCEKLDEKRKFSKYFLQFLLP